MRLVYSLQCGVLFAVPVLLSCGIIQQIVPLHDSEDLSYLRDNWVQAFFHSQPLGVQQIFSVQCTCSVFTDIELS